MEPPSMDSLGRLPTPAKPLLIWGAGGHAKVVADVARASGWEVIGFLEETPHRHGHGFYGASILGGSEVLHTVDRHPCREVFIAIGDNVARDRCLDVAIRAGYSVPILIHPTATISPTAKLASGTVVMAGAVVQSDTEIGAGAIINTGASVDHDGVLGRCVHLGPGVRLTGQVQIGDLTMGGAGAVVIPGVRIGQRCLIGAGAVVIFDIPDGQTAVGVPARLISRSEISV